MKISQQGLQLIKSYESLELETYLDAVGVPTIGFGHTGPDVYIGMRITESQAYELLLEDINEAEEAVLFRVKVPLNQNQFDALVSFTFNVGTGALSRSTLVNRLNTGEPINTVLAQELPRWVKGDNGIILQGLVNRRQAELKHVLQGTSTMTKKGFLKRSAENYKFLPHQNEAYDYLEANVDPEVFDTFMSKFSPPKPPAPSKPKFPLAVPYFYQRDSQKGHGERMCFSSAMAMAMDYLDPESIAGDDDWYLQQVFKYGDTVSSTAQIAAARSLGFTEAEFFMNGSEQDLIKLLDAGIPVPIGILHRGPISKPSGGGHWVTLIGYTSTHFFVHDPYGELDLINGGYPITGPTAGKAIKYTRKNLMRRWLIHSKNDGWYVRLERF